MSKMYYTKLSREEGWSVEAVETGRRALEAIKKTAPDLVLLDIILPDINGVQLLKTIRQDPNLKETPVLMLTNLNDKDYIGEALQLGVEGYLIKAHFTPNEVVDKIRQILRSKEKK
ncbi:MAG: Response regulator receiver protein [Parcubacteria group bacterium GW2011_GWA2_42_28]|nr:MAG: Response regulator receiver protein [Parcubacteria group bacterium GW2011_GWA2_42_28]KKT53893.1 MAG: Response regulator receiver protein [Parcubacteria group bacterium GW2011_GWC2_44_22]